MANFDAELNRIINATKFPFSPGEALWFSDVDPGVLAFEWKHGRVGPARESRVLKRRHAFNLNDILYLAGLVELGPVRGPKWREELRRGFHRAVRRGTEVYGFGPYPVTMAPIRRRLVRRLRRLVAMRSYVTGQKNCLFVTGTTVSPFLIAKRMAEGDGASLRLEYPELTDRDVRRARRYAELHLGPTNLRDYRAPMKALAAMPPATRLHNLSGTVEMVAGAMASCEATPLSIQAWRAKHAGR